MIRRSSLAGFTALALLSIVPGTRAQQDSEITARVNVTTNAVHIGDVIEVQLHVLHPSDSEIRIPELRRGKQLVTRNDQVQKKETREGLVQTTITYDLSSFAIGHHTLFTNGIHCTLANGTIQTGAPPFAVLNVVSLRAEGESGLRPPKDLVTWPSRLPFLLLGLVLLLLIAFLVFYLIRKHTHRDKDTPVGPPPPPPHEVALRALAHLKEKGWIEQGLSESFYVELSSIVRLYLEKRFNLRAPEQTTEEFIRAAAGSQHLQPEHRTVTKSFLEQSDLVKFARYEPDSSMMNNAMTSAEKLVHDTTPSPQPEESP